jgi:hypothetical protein
MTSELPLTFRTNHQLTLNVFADAAYGIHDDRKSQSGICIRLGNSTLITKSGKQKLVTKSSTEAELVACSDSISFIYSTKKLLKDFGIDIKDIIIHQDNQSTIKLIQNKKPTSQRSQHIDIKYFFLRDQTIEKDITIQYTPTEEMIADILTKPLQGNQFIKLRNTLMNNA